MHLTENSIEIGEQYIQKQITKTQLERMIKNRFEVIVTPYGRDKRSDDEKKT